ncbi:putative dynamin GTPase [Rostrohypoxylon terebratum]|nr:putative dynamin GTPase [Rostrohypoxylon terebratum]
MIIEGTNLSISELGSLRLMQRSQQIIEARAKGLGDTTSSPQIVVCGNRSSGKNSFLEGLTGIPSPQGDGGCTKFPIEIVFRYIDASLPEQITASLLPCNDRSPGIQHAFRKFQLLLSDLYELPKIIEEVSSSIDAHNPDTFGADKTVATDILRIQFIASTSLAISTELVGSYLSSSNTVTVAVFEASDIDTREQSSKHLVLKHDPHFSRSVGVFTKADLCNSENRHNVAARIKELDAKLPHLQFCLLPPPSEHQRKFDIFCQEVWNKIRPHGSHVGLENLKKFVQELLEEKIKCELPKACYEIEAKLGKVEEKMKLLGNERSTIGQIRSSLLGTTMRFFQLAQAAHNCYYEEATTGFFSAKHNRLRPQIHTTNKEFSKFMVDYGVRRTETESPSVESTDEIHPGQLSVTPEEMLGWIEDNLSQKSGPNFPGNFSYMSLAELFREQSSRWPAIAKNHIKRVDEMISAWVTRAVEEITHEDHLRHHIMSLCRKGLDETRKLAYDELEKLIADESGQLITYSDGCEVEVDRSQDSSTMQVLKSLVLDAFTSTGDSRGISVATRTGGTQLVLDKDEVAKKIRKINDQLEGMSDPMDLLKQGCQYAKTTLDSYYEVAMRRFVDNVCRQVVERHYMKRLPGIFSPQTVAELSDDSLLLIGSEPQTQQNRRPQLKAETHSLRESLANLQKPLSI